MPSRFLTAKAVSWQATTGGTGWPIATQYVDPKGAPAAGIGFNPNGSVCAIEGITSPDGRIFGKMGHSERTDHECYRNVPGEKEQKLFVSGIKYFQ